MKLLTFAVGDVHGRFDLLERAADAITSYAAGRPSRVIMLGDYVDRGPDSRAVIEWLMERTADPEASIICLKGNHESMMAAACGHGVLIDWWCENGGDATLRNYPDGVPREHVAWLEALPLMARDEHRAFVHAGLMPGFPPDEQDEEACLWIRERFLRAGDDWGVHVVHGHTPIWDCKPDPSKPELLAHRTNLDTGAFHTGVLTVGVFDHEEPGGPIALISVTEDGATPQNLEREGGSISRRATTNSPTITFPPGGKP
jgi:serine/threonine protein phosphatase 1